MLKAIAFDLDGTLVDSVIDLSASANAVRLHMGLPVLPDKRIRTFIGDGVASLLQRSLTDHLDGKLEPQDLATALSVFHLHYGQHLAENTRPYAGVVTALDALQQQGWPLAVVTNKPENHTHALLAALNLTQYFKVVIGGDTLPKRKPHAEPLLEAAQRLGLEASQVLMIGDSPNDVLCARAAGSPVWVVDYGYAEAGNLNADRVMSSLEEMLALLEQK